MFDGPICVENTGLVTSVGHNAFASCAAMRSKLSNPSETRFADISGDWLPAHQIEAFAQFRGLEKLAWMTTAVIKECLDPVPSIQWKNAPLLLCVAERGRPQRLEGLDELLSLEIQRIMQTQFGPGSAVISEGRVGVGIALHTAQKLIWSGRAERVVVAAVDSLVDSAVISAYLQDDRLMTQDNSNGLIVGEAAGALLLTRQSKGLQLRLTGIGFGTEKANIGSDLPLRADGLTSAIKKATAEAGIDLHQLDYRIADMSGEHYYFKEAALAVGRLLRVHKEELDIWHPAESVGETGAAVGAIIIALADAAMRKGFAPGPRVLIHLSGDDGHRVALVLEFGAIL